jgi:acyl-CoA dehydrogenase
VRRDIFTADHEAFRSVVRDFVAKEIVPHYTDWEKAGRMPREVFGKLGALGGLGMAIPEAYGGAGLVDYRYNVILQEEASRALVTLGTVRTQIDVILPYFLAYADEAQQARWFPGLAAGRLLTAIAMTEPGTGWTSSASKCRTRPNWPSTTYGCRWPTGWARRGPRSAISGTTWPRSG